MIDHSEFAWELTYEEIDYVIEGTLTVTIDGKKYTANAGDVLFVPSGSNGNLGFSGQGKSILCNLSGQLGGPSVKEDINAGAGYDRNKGNPGSH